VAAAFADAVIVLAADDAPAHGVIVDPDAPFAAVTASSWTPAVC